MFIPYHLPRKWCLPTSRNIPLSSRHPGHPTFSTAGPHQPAATLTPAQPHRPLELRVCRAPAFTPALSTASPAPGTLDLVPRLRPLLGLPVYQPLSRGPSGLQGADHQRHGCPGPMDTGGRALSHHVHWNPSRPAPCCLGVPRSRNTTLHRKPSHWRGAEPPNSSATCGSLLTSLPHCRAHTVPSWLGGPEPVSGNCPRGDRGHLSCHQHLGPSPVL